MRLKFKIFYAIACWVTACMMAPLWAQQNILDKTISISIEEKKTSNILLRISESTGAKFAYDKRNIPIFTPISVSVKDMVLKEFLSLIFKGSNVEFKAVENQISLFRSKLPKYTISGYLRDAASGEALIGGNIFESHSFKGTTANHYGYYSLTLAEGHHAINWSYLGFGTRRDSIHLSKNLNINVLLKSQNTLKEIVVTPQDSIRDNKFSLKSPVSTSEQINGSAMETFPALLGERDILRVVGLFPGVQSGSEGANGLSIRGGGPDQNLVLLDGTPVYNVYHLFGFVSVFNDQAINSAEIIRGSFSARYGGRLSSVLDVRMKEGNMKEYHGGLSLGIISGNLHLEGPIVKDKTAFFVSARRTWLDLLVRSIAGLNDANIRGGYGFYDVNAKINHRFTQKDRLYFSYFMGDDRSFQKQLNNPDGRREVTESTQGWGNKVASLRWNRVLGPKAFINTTLTYSNNLSNNQTFATSDKRETDPNKINEFDFKTTSRIDDIGINQDLDVIPNAKHYLRFGGGYVYHINHPSKSRNLIKQQGLLDTLDIQAPTINSHEFQLYAEDDFTINKKFRINTGLRLAGTWVNGGSEIGYQAYMLPQLRISAYWQVHPYHGFSASYSGMAQFFHLLTDTGIGFPSDQWVPSTNQVKPAYAHIFDLGYDWRIRNSIKISVGTYYKAMSNLLEYKDGATYISKSTDWENQVISGTGESYGAEVFLSRSRKKTTGWLSYTLSWSKRHFEAINDGNPFPYRYDHRHSLSAVLNHKFGPRVNVGAVWTYGTGQVATLSLERFQSLNSSSPFLGFGGNEVFDIGQRNNFRMPPSHRLDISLNLNKLTRFGQRTWSLGIINVYGRQNPFAIYPRSLNERTVEVVQFSMLPFPIPYATYRFRF